MKKIISLIAVLFTAIVLTGCSGELDSLEWSQLPESVYDQVVDETDQALAVESFMDAAKVKINGTEVTLKQAVENHGATVTGFDLTSEGSKVITVKYASLTIYWAYQVGAAPSNVVTPKYDWYDGASSTYTLSSIEDLYGFANIVNGKDSRTADSFAGKTVKLADDIDLTGKVWTPIGEGVRKNPLLVTYADLQAADLKSANLDGYKFTEDETYFKSLLDSHEPVEDKDYENNIYIDAYYFAKRISENSYEYYNSKNDAVTGNVFSGTFDGQGNTITGLSDIGYTPFTTVVYANSEKMLKGYAFGLFGLLEAPATVKNLTFEDVQIIGAYYDSGEDEVVLAEIDSCGAAIGFVMGEGDLLIDNVKVLSGSITGEDAIAGIVGRAYNLGEITFKNSENRANISSNGHAGGMVAYLANQTPTVLFENNTNYGNIASIGSSKYAGSMFSYHKQTGVTTIKDCRNFGNISGMNYDTLDRTCNGMTSGYKPNTWYNETGCQNYGTLTKK